MNDLTALREENDLLREEVAMLKHQLGTDEDSQFSANCHEVLHLTGGETKMLRVLMRSRVTSKSSLYDGCYGDDELDGPDIKIIDVFVCKLRRKLAPHNIPITTVWGVGYLMPPDSKKRLNELLVSGWRS